MVAAAYNAIRKGTLTALERAATTLVYGGVMALVGVVVAAVAGAGPHRLLISAAAVLLLLGGLGLLVRRRQRSWPLSSSELQVASDILIRSASRHPGPDRRREAMDRALVTAGACFGSPRSALCTFKVRGRRLALFRGPGTTTEAEVPEDLQGAYLTTAEAGALTQGEFARERELFVDLAALWKGGWRSLVSAPVRVGPDQRLVAVLVGLSVDPERFDDDTVTHLRRFAELLAGTWDFQYRRLPLRERIRH